LSIIAVIIRKTKGQTIVRLLSTIVWVQF